MTPFALLEDGLRKEAAAPFVTRLLRQLALANRSYPLGITKLQREAAQMGRFGKTLKLDSGLDKLDSLLAKRHPGFDPAAVKSVAEGGPLKMVQKRIGTYGQTID